MVILTSPLGWKKSAGAPQWFGPTLKGSKFVHPVKLIKTEKSSMGLHSGVATYLGDFSLLECVRGLFSSLMR